MPTGYFRDEIRGLRSDHTNSHKFKRESPKTDQKSSSIDLRTTIFTTCLYSVENQHRHCILTSGIIALDVI